MEGEETVSDSARAGELALLEETIAELLSRELKAIGAVDGFSPALWERLEEAGLPLAGVPEPWGGPGGGLEEAAVVPAPAGIDAVALRRRGALARAIGLAGVLERVLELTASYAREREQFGRPLARFQAIQQELALLAGEVAAARAAVDAAVERP